MLDRTVAAMRDLIFNMGFFTYKTTVALLRPSQASPNIFRAFSYNVSGATPLTLFTSTLQIACQGLVGATARRTLVFMLFAPNWCTACKPRRWPFTLS